MRRPTDRDMVLFAFLCLWAAVGLGILLVLFTAKPALALTGGLL